jgi:hypothetical protein
MRVDFLVYGVALGFWQNRTPLAHIWPPSRLIKVIGAVGAPDRVGNTTPSGGV